MEIDPRRELADVRHDINSKCANLKTAAAQLSGESTSEELELLALMDEQARALAQRISAYAAMRAAGPRK